MKTQLKAVTAATALALAGGAALAEGELNIYNLSLIHI